MYPGIGHTKPLALKLNVFSDEKLEESNIEESKLSIGAVKKIEINKTNIDKIKKG